MKSTDIAKPGGGGGGGVLSKKGVWPQVRHTKFLF